jgi:hypothetical protein
LLNIEAAAVKVKIGGRDENGVMPMELDVMTYADR